MWEKQWRFKGMPELGDYIAVKAYGRDGILLFHKGVVLLVNEETGCVKLSNTGPTDDLVAMAWKKWIGPEIESKQPIARKLRQTA